MVSVIKCIHFGKITANNAEVVLGCFILVVFQGMGAQMRL